MDRREKADSPEIAARSIGEGVKAELWVAMPGILAAVDLVKMTCSVQPSIKARVQNPALEWAWVTMPLLVDCPIVFPSGGGATLTFPLKVGDECLVIFADRCIDAWWQSGGIQQQIDYRMHSLSDGFVIPGPHSQPRVVTGISASAVELRLDDASAKVSIDASSKAVSITSPSSISLNAPTVTINGNSVVTGTSNLQGSTTIQGKAFLTHAHTGVATGPGTSGGVA